MSSQPFSDAEESNVMQSTTSTSSTTSRKKRKANRNFADSWQTPYPYTHKGGNTSNMIAYLHDKHNIIKDNYTDFLDKHNEPKCDQTKVTDYYNNTTSPCSSQRQKLIARKLIQFIIQFIQPLYILQDPSFRKFVYASKSHHGYLGVTTTWLSSDFKLNKALFSCNHLAYPHTGEVICEELIRLIHKWQLDAMIFTIATDNRTNMVKEIRLLQEIISDVECQPCAMYTLQLSAQHLCKAQYEFNVIDDNQNIIESPLDIITDIKTR
ncbi:1881_t:CDS:2 [Cetraspora pellucida]|uniref:1881_t:CDS:1 n=1 Tax=Cetraspora pellucida TaxID=1433469 RepID=A0ACA9MD00_9GLOM|nr:1881_t:CDS:2 [Cetraspora pellucida]